MKSGWRILAGLCLGVGWLIGSLAAAEPPATGTAGLSPGVASPAIDLRSAVAMAETYVRDHQVDLADQYLASVSLRYDLGKGKSFWLVQWAWRQPRMGGEYGLWIYLDGTIDCRPTGP